MIDHDQQASAHNADIPYDILKQAAMLLVKAREAEQRRSPSKRNGCGVTRATC